MSLLRLLTAGKSLVGLKNTEYRYSVAPGLLPEFASKKNPFRAGARPQAGGVPAELAPAALVTGPDEVNSAHSGTGSDGAAMICAAEAPKARATGSDQVERRLSEETRKDSPVGWRAFLPWMRRRRPKPVIPRFHKTMVQGELTLESIKVVRNDLSDSDLEVVPTKPIAPTPPDKPARRASIEPRTNGSSWERLTGRFLGAGKT